MEAHAAHIEQVALARACRTHVRCAPHEQLVQIAFDLLEASGRTTHTQHRCREFGKLWRGIIMSSACEAQREMKQLFGRSFSASKNYLQWRFGSKSKRFASKLSKALEGALV